MFPVCPIPRMREYTLLTIYRTTIYNFLKNSDSTVHTRILPELLGRGGELHLVVTALITEYSTAVPELGVKMHFYGQKHTTMT